MIVKQAGFGDRSDAQNISWFPIDPLAARSLAFCVEVHGMKLTVSTYGEALQASTIPVNTSSKSTFLFSLQPVTPEFSVVVADAAPSRSDIMTASPSKLPRTTPQAPKVSGTSTRVYANWLKDNYALFVNNQDQDGKFVIVEGVI